MNPVDHPHGGEKERLLEGDTQFLLGVNQNLEHEVKETI